MSSYDGYFIGQRLHGIDLSDKTAVLRALEEYEVIQLHHTTSQVNGAYFLGQLFHHVPFPLTLLRDCFLDWTGFLQGQVGDRNPQEIIAQLSTMGPGVSPYTE
ncbi:uncharacterized protein F5Z01DRAFT_175294 [Emericellopsis atlantica]|uniref:Uncharacterized protein n=1 Tax=Emericellopsis atlantica TaxID=2614577 RepID=A0A9P7ZJE8_9HYPO|nr:uncharacterized protein F5Z01DRAFT_175294 [Emericellopsis atlantica]KAG9253120.1 hypothetical protein F5Z01DRAFT_175294 [Emericellopsis atlantica]